MDQVSIGPPPAKEPLASSLRKRTGQILAQVRMYFLNRHFVLCFGIAWLFTNGWAYIALGIGTFFGWPWLISVSSAYLALLWVPFTPEKLITVMIAMLLLKRIFPNDRNALELLENIRKAAEKKRRNQRSRKKASEKNGREKA